VSAVRDLSDVAPHADWQSTPHQIFVSPGAAQAGAAHSGAAQLTGAAQLGQHGSTGQHGSQGTWRQTV
jgi:hypothetical protein